MAPIVPMAPQLEAAATLSTRHRSAVQTEVARRAANSQLVHRDPTHPRHLQCPMQLGHSSRKIGQDTIIGCRIPSRSLSGESSCIVVGEQIDSDSRLVLVLTETESVNLRTRWN